MTVSNGASLGSGSPPAAPVSGVVPDALVDVESDEHAAAAATTAAAGRSREELAAGEW